jgi:hypothetical protein
MIKRLLTASLLLLVSVQVSAAIISAINTNAEFESGKFADLQGLEWLSLDVTAGKSRSEIDAGFDDLLLNGWQFATRNQAETLVTSLWGGSYSGWSNDNYSGASWFINSFRPLAYSSSGNYEDQYYSKFLFGSDLECSSQIAYTCFGTISTVENYKLDITNATNSTGQHFVLSYTANSGQGGLFYYSQGLNAGDWDDTNIAKSKGDSNSNWGSLLVRASSIPEPSIIALFALGLVGIGIARIRQS